MVQKKIILTGDRPTGPLHLGHYVGSLQQRVALQHLHNQFVLIADLQALTDNVDNPDKVKNNVIQLLMDYYAVGIDYTISHIFIQSLIPEIAELAILYLNLVTVNRLKRNPTVKTEIAQKNFGELVTAGFLMYPVHQAADITIVRANLVPVGADQLPMIEQTNEIIDKFNGLYGNTFERVEPLIPKKGGRLPGIDGQAKMSKSLGNAIYLSDSKDVVHKKVMSMYTDPHHIHVSDPGHVEGNVVFMYLDIFDSDLNEVARLKERYQAGGLGDVVLKKRLSEILNNFLDPIRKKRAEVEQDNQWLLDSALKSTEKVRFKAQETMQLVKHALKLVYV
jgi:tryptophanyl-tRNA synthetase